MLGPAEGTIITGSTDVGRSIGDSDVFVPSNRLPPAAGFIPRLLYDLFHRIEKEKTESTENPEMGALDELHKVEVSYVEIYCERLRDLLNPYPSASGIAASQNGSLDSIHRTHPLKLREDPEKGAYVEGATVHAVSDYKDVFDLLRDGNAVRSVAATRMNNLSSRSHAILTLQYTRTTINRKAQTAHDRKSLVHLVDLAGSERVRKSGASGKRLKETGSINKSLLHLGMVIRKLAYKDRSSRFQSSDNVTTRSSVLTQLLRQSLGGNSKTAMIANVAPENVHADETLSTLRYASDAKRIVNRAVVNEDPNLSLIRQLKGEIQNLRNALSQATKRAEIAESRVYGSTPKTVSGSEESEPNQGDPLEEMVSEWNRKLERSRLDATTRRENLLQVSAVNNHEVQGDDEGTDNTGDSMEAADEHIELLQNRGGYENNNTNARQHIPKEDISFTWFRQLQQLAVSRSHTRLCSEMQTASRVASLFNRHADLLLVPMRAIAALVARPIRILNKYFSTNRISPEQAVVHALDESFETGALRTLSWEDISSIEWTQDQEDTAKEDTNEAPPAKSMASRENTEDSSLHSHHQVGIILINCYTGVERTVRDVKGVEQLGEELKHTYNSLLLKNEGNVPFGLRDFSSSPEKLVEGHRWIGTTKLALVGLTKGKQIRVTVPIVREEMLRKHDEGKGGKKQHRHSAFLGKVDAEVEISHKPILGQKLQIWLRPKNILIESLQGIMGQGVRLEFLNSLIIVFCLPKPLRSVSHDVCYHVFCCQIFTRKNGRLHADPSLSAYVHSKGGRDASWSLVMSEEALEALATDDMTAHVFGSFSEPEATNTEDNSEDDTKKRTEKWMPLALRLAGVTSHDLVKQIVADSTRRYCCLRKVDKQLQPQWTDGDINDFRPHSTFGISMSVDFLSTVNEDKGWYGFPIQRGQICEIPSLDNIISDQASKGIEILRLGNVIHSVGWEPQFNVNTKILSKRTVSFAMLIKEYNTEHDNRTCYDPAIESCLNVSVSAPAAASDQESSGCTFYSCTDISLYREVKTRTLAMSAVPSWDWQSQLISKSGENNQNVVAFVVRVQLSVRDAIQPVEFAHLMVCRVGSSRFQHEDLASSYFPAWKDIPKGASILQTANTSRYAHLASCYVGTLEHKPFHRESSYQSDVEDLLLWQRVQNSRLYVAVNSISYSQHKKAGTTNFSHDLSSRQQFADSVAPAPKPSCDGYNINIDLDEHIVSGFLDKKKGEDAPNNLISGKAASYFNNMLCSHKDWYDGTALTAYELSEQRSLTPDLPQDVVEVDCEDEDQQKDALSYVDNDSSSDGRSEFQLHSKTVPSHSMQSPLSKSHSSSFRQLLGKVRREWTKRWFILHGPFLMYFPSATDVEQRKSPRKVIFLDQAVSVLFSCGDDPRDRGYSDKRNHGASGLPDSSVSDVHSVVSVSPDRPNIFARAVSVTRSRPRSGDSTRTHMGSVALTNGEVETYLSFFIGHSHWDEHGLQVKWWQLKAPELYDKPRWLRSLKCRAYLLEEDESDKEKAAR